tara:strand:+ start:5597 stop:5788 length:192 start_codon:yes stop_codon:yes gene_type:complete
MYNENKSKKIIFGLKIRVLSRLKITKNIILKKTKNSVTATPAIKDNGIKNKSIFKFLLIKYFI